MESMVVHDQINHVWEKEEKGEVQLIFSRSDIIAIKMVIIVYYITLIIN